MLINYDLNAIYFHNPKCGGNFTWKLLIDYINFCGCCLDVNENYIDIVENKSYLHRIQYMNTIRKLCNYRYFYSHQFSNKSQLDTFFKFIFVRNPYTKLLSGYTYLKRDLEYEINTIKGIPENPEYFSDFNTFVKNYKNVNSTSFYHAFICQYEHIIDFSNNCNFQYIGKTETLNDELLDILTLIDSKEIINKNLFNRKKENVSNYEKEITEYFNEETFQFVNDFFKLDFEIFGYKRYNTFEEFKLHFLQDQTTGKIDVQPKSIKINQIPDYFIKISSFIEKKTASINDQLIPKIIIQTYKHNLIHPLIYENIMELLRKNPSYDYYFINDEDGLRLIEENFDIDTLNAFKKLTVGAAKGDFIRYIALYLYGGVYLDLDASIEMDLDHFIPPDNDYVFFIESFKPQITNWCIMITPKHTLIKKIIDEMVERINTNNETNILKITGPHMMSDVIYKHFTNVDIFFLHKNLSHDSFLEFIINKNKSKKTFFETYFLIQNKLFNFRFDGYQTNMMYYNDLHYEHIPGYNIYSENIEKIIIDTITNNEAKYVNFTNYNNLVTKYESICNILIDEVKKRSNYKLNEIDIIKNDIDVLNKQVLEEQNKNKKLETEINNMLFDTKRETLLKNNVQYCKKCEFKSYNTIAYNAHKYFCDK